MHSYIGRNLALSGVTPWSSHSMTTPNMPYDLYNNAALVRNDIKKAIRDIIDTYYSLP